MITEELYCNFPKLDALPNKEQNKGRNRKNTTISKQYS